MVTNIHPNAVVDPTARLAEGVTVGPFAVIGAGVEVGAGTQVDAAAQIRGPARLGENNHVYSFACLGFDPQDLKFKGEETRLVVGDGNHFREHCTVHRGTASGTGVTTIGSHNLFMVGAHVAHDCVVGDHTIFANNGTLAGHVEVADHAVIGAFTSVHQFCRVGRHAYLGGYTVLTRDALPFVKTVGGKPACYGVNRIGLERQGFTPAQLSTLEGAYRILVRSGLNTSQAIERLGDELAGEPLVQYLIDFVAGSRRGVIREVSTRHRTRGG